MPIFAIGLNHKTAPVSLREQVYFRADRLSAYLQEVLGLEGVHEAVLLSTCSRSELYCDAAHLSVAREWFLAQAAMPFAADLQAAIYCYEEEAAILHLMKIACGLDSMILGESQVLSQLKTAFFESYAASAVGPLFHRLFQQVFAVSKQIRTATTLGACPFSIASCAVRFVKARVASFETAKVVVLGAGETSALLLKYLAQWPLLSLTVLNRNLEKATALVKNQGVAMPLAALEMALKEADIIFAATESPLPLVTRDMIQYVMQKRAHRPMLFMDLAVPANIAREVASEEKITLYTLDHLKQAMDVSADHHAHAVAQALQLVEQASQALFRQLQSFDKIAETIRLYRSQIEAMAALELDQAKHALRRGKAPERVLDEFAHAFINKLMHAPSVKLREAGERGRFELLRFAKQLFILPEV